MRQKDLGVDTMRENLFFFWNSLQRIIKKKKKKSLEACLLHAVPRPHLCKGRGWRDGGPPPKCGGLSIEGLVPPSGVSLHPHESEERLGQ